VEGQPLNKPYVCIARCRAGGLCIAVCHCGALEAGEQQTRVAHPDLCDACLACEDVCPEGAIEVDFGIVWGEPAGDAPDCD
jgi:NAD-dependent dihydropyrimidine dehydrogenase PreA subunit